MTTTTRKPRMTDEEKRAIAHAKKLASLTILGRATFKATGAQLYAVQSGEKTYHVTRIAGRVRSCVDAETGETCQARYYGSNHCCHGEVVDMLEAQRESELATAAQVAPLIVGQSFASDLSTHLDDEMPVQPIPCRQYESWGGPDDTLEHPAPLFSCVSCGYLVKRDGSLCHKCAA
jgi:hypothetical protein